MYLSGSKTYMPSLQSDGAQTHLKFDLPNIGESSNFSWLASCFPSYLSFHSALSDLFLDLVFP